MEQRYRRQAGTYIRMLRMQQRVSQDQLAEAAGVRRATIDRMERGDSRIFVGTMLRAWAFLGASPALYGLLMLSEEVSIFEVQREHATASALTLYVMTVAERRKQLLHPPSVALSAEAIQPGLPILTELALLRAVINLDLPIADVAQILRAEDSHREVALQLAEAYQPDLISSYEDGGTHPTYPVLDYAIRRLKLLERNISDLSLSHAHDLAHIIAQLERLRTFVIAPMQLQPEPLRGR